MKAVTEVDRFGGQLLRPEDGIEQEELFDQESEVGSERQEALLAGSFDEGDHGIDLADDLDSKDS